MGRKQIPPQYPLQILSKKLINPAIPTPHNLRNLKISALDQLYPTLYLPFIFFYPNFSEKEFQLAGKKLEKSLSKILTLFYPLAGSYIDDNLSIDCNDNGVEFIETLVNGKLSPLLGRDVDCRQLSHLIPHQFESLTSPLLAIQCNIFECGGLAIGLCISHKIVDGFSFTKFIDAWATSCRLGLHKVDYPSFDLPTLLPTRETVPEIKPVQRFNPGLKTASRTFVFDGSAISNLRKIAIEGGKESHKPSRVQLVTAIIWKALMRVCQTKHGQLRPSIICHTMNMRGRTALPISDDCCGNLFRPVIVKFTLENKSNKVEFHHLVSLLGNAIRSTVTDCAKPQNGDDFSSMVSDAWKEAGEELNKDTDKVDAYGFTSLCRMPIYPDFGWGMPARVTHVQSVVELIMLFDTRDGDGVEAWISLDENDMNVFQQDPDIIAFTSQVDH
ncbi:hypothetical protein Patl1_26397 [Pistacia atlantica]|uniref:Uncharacterized protein n=1 Tax=Pistacia atlantica TaxID=434234 RepID=A0ACC1B3L7_9ROSI|nr:hypothetical protein Patl1_26397 [Pistacia atlantica]